MKLCLILPMLALMGWASGQVLTPATGAPVPAAGIAGAPSIIPPNIPGAPFSADTITEISRHLQNSQPTHTILSGKLYRDSEGRTRRETQSQDGGRTIVITDPVRRVMILFNASQKTARIYHWQSPKTGGQAQAGATAASANLPAQPWSAPTQSPPGATLALRGGGPLTPVPASPSIMPVKTHVEKLEDRELDGVMVTGTRITRTTEAGAPGTAMPMVSTTETWFSPELKLTILSETNNPQSGQTVTKLVSLQRSEPDASLFEAPPDYTVQDGAKQ